MFHRVVCICGFKNDLFNPFNYPENLAGHIYFISILEEETGTQDYRVY